MWNDMDPEGRKKMFEDIEKRLLVKRVGKADEIAEAYLFIMKFVNPFRLRCDQITNQLRQVWIHHWPTR
jgi:hypothetical protein